MVLGWRRAFCTSLPKHRDSDNHCKSPKISSKFGFFSNPSTPRLPVTTCRSHSSAPTSPRVHSKASSAQTPEKTRSESPRSPSTFSLLKSSLRISTKRNRCGICCRPVKGGQGTASFTGECSHVFHVNCLAAHFKGRRCLRCPLCDTAWKELSLLPICDSQKPIERKDVKIKSLRVYNDDEPLMSPAAGARFNPIPESNETDEEDDDGPREFQGFFVNPTFSNSLKSNVAVNLIPGVALVAVGWESETSVVRMRVKAPPERNVNRRPPIDLVTVLEVSDSKLGTLKRVMRLVISSLSESDRLSILAISVVSKRLLPLRRMTESGKRSARGIVDALARTGEVTCVGDAIKKAEKVLEDRRQKNSVARIVLFSDGRSHRGGSIVSPTRFSHADTPIHAVSISACSNAPSDATLVKSLNVLLSVVVQDLRLKLGFGSGSGQARVNSVYSVTGKPKFLGSDLIRLGDFFAGEERELLVEFTTATCSSGPHQIMSVRPSFKDPSSGVLVHSKDQPLVVTRPLTVRSSSPGIKRLMNLHVTVRAVAESRRLIEHSDFSGAQRLLSSARAVLMKSSVGSEEFLRGLEVEQADLHRRRLLSLKQREGSRTLSEVVQKSEPLTPTSAWRAAEKLAELAVMRKSMNRVSDLHGFENARF